MWNFDANYDITFRQKPERYSSLIGIAFRFSTSYVTFLHEERKQRLGTAEWLPTMTKV